MFGSMIEGITGSVGSSKGVLGSRFVSALSGSLACALAMFTACTRAAYGHCPGSFTPIVQYPIPGPAGYSLPN